MAAITYESLRPLLNATTIGPPPTAVTRQAFEYESDIEQNLQLNERSHHMLGTCYMFGLGGVEEPSTDRALWHFAQAADFPTGRPSINMGRAMFQVTAQLLAGREGEISQKQVQFVQKVVPNLQSADDAESKLYLGILHSKGVLVEQNFQAAINFFTSSAENGNKQALYQLGKHYFNGWGVTRDVVEAVRLFDLSFENQTELNGVVSRSRGLVDVRLELMDEDVLTEIKSNRRNRRIELAEKTALASFASAPIGIWSLGLPALYNKADGIGFDGAYKIVRSIVGKMFGE